MMPCPLFAFSPLEMQSFKGEQKKYGFHSLCLRFPLVQVASHPSQLGEPVCQGNLQRVGGKSS